MNKIILSLCVTFICFTAFGQNEVTARGPNKMVAKERNYTSFSEPFKKVVNQEILRHTSDKFKSHPDLGINPYNTQCEDCFEVLEERTANTRHFLKNGSNGRIFYNQSGASPINYQDAKGYWRAIDPRIFPSENMPGVYEAINQPSPTRIDLNKKQVSVFNGSAELSFNRNLKLYHKTGSTKALIAVADWSAATAGNDGVYVKNIFPGIDLEVYSISGALKTNFIVRNKPSFNDGFLVIEDNMKLPYGTSFSTSAATKNENGYQGLITVNADQSNIPLYEIGEAVGFDMSDRRINPAEKFSYIVESGSLSIVMPLTWFNKQGMIYPLTIDPLVSSTNTLLQASIAGSGGNGSGTFDAATACPYTLVVATPANCTITDIRFAFDYLAQNGAVRNEGATDFLYNACRSPSGAGFYWFCNTPTAGACTTGVAGISVLSDFQSCIPAPQCAPYNMSFTMRFYDRFGGACSNTFIKANSNWVMTVEGQTVDFTNPGTPFTLSANTICFGQTISASTGTQYGVPPHTVNWSYSASGTPSVGTGNNPTLSFPSAGTYTVYCTVTDGCGISATSNQVVTVNPIPSLTVTASPDPICVGQSSTLTASGANTYTWSASAGGGTGPTAVVTPAVGTAVYSFTATTTATGCVNSGTVSVTVNALPTLTVVASPTVVCSGATSTLTANGATSYVWSANAGGGSANPVSVSPVATDVYTVTGTDANSCSNTATVSVNVTPSPTITASANTATICAGQMDTLSVSGATTYTWMPGGLNTSTISVTPASTTSYVVTGDNGGACTATRTVVVTVNPLPAIIITPSSNPLCSGQTGTLTATGGTTYTWSANAGGVNTSAVTISPSGTDTYTVAATQSGCSDSTTITITIVTQPTVSIVATQTLFCSGDSTTLTASGATNYTWIPGGSTASSVTVTPTITTTYSLTGANGSCLDSTTISISVNATPTLTAVANPATICSGSTSTLSVSGGLTYTWSANAASVVNDSAIVSPGSTDTFTVYSTNSGCSDSTMITVVVVSQPTVGIAATQTLMCSGDSTVLTASGATNYTWMPGGSTAGTLTVNPTSPTTYSLNGANGSCLDSTSITIMVNPTPTITVVASQTAICSGDSSLLIASGATTFTWMPVSVVNDSAYVTPNVTTTYTVTGDSLGCTSTQTITINGTTTPTVGITTPTPTACTGQSVTMVATGATTYTWSPNAGSVTTSSVVAVVNACPTTTFTVVGANGNCLDSTTISISVNPTPTITAVANPTVICSGDSALLIADGATTFTWMPGNISNDSAYVSPGSLQTFTVTGDSLGCTSTQTVTVNVNPSPVLIALGTPTVVCSGQSAALVANGTATTYTWSANAGGGTSQFAVVFPTTNPTTYTVTGTLGSCTSFTTVSIGVVTTPTVTAVASPTVVCSGDSVMMVASANPPTSALSWSPGGSVNDTVWFTASTATIYSVVASNGACSDTAYPALTVNTTPTLTAVSPQTVCSGNPVSAINFVTTPAGQMVGWSNSNTAIGIAAGGNGNIAGYTAPNVSTAQVGTIIAQVMDMTTGCVGNTQTFNITINPSPTISGIPDTSGAYCGLPGGYIKDLSASGGTGSITYQWYNGGVAIPGATKDSLVNVFGGVYSLVATDALGCSAYSQVFTIPSTPSVSAAFTASTYSGTASLPVSFTNGSTGATSYNWNFGTGSGSTATDPSFTYNSGGTYQVILTAINGPCQDTAMRTIIVEQPISVTVPNIFSPNGDNINDVFGIITSGVTELTCDIFNRWGQKVHTFSGPTGNWDGKLDNGNKATEGTYFYVVIAKSFDGKQHKQQGSLTLVE